MSEPDRRAPAPHSGIPTQRAAVGVVPAPLHHAALPGNPFRLGDDLRIVGTTDGGAAAVADQLSRLLGRPVPVGDPDDAAPGAVVVQAGAPWRADDGGGVPPAGAYRLTVRENQVALRAVDPTGLAHAATTLALLADDDAVQPTLVVDSPRFAWRGITVDATAGARDLTAMAHLLDVMAELKLNVLHLRLVGRQGWRLAVASHPGDASVDAPGSLTADDLAAVQSLATTRGITLVPEVDVPGYLDAAAQATGPAPSGQPLDTLLRDALGEVATLTAGPSLHVGGDAPTAMDPAEYRRLVDLACATVSEAGRTPVGRSEVSRAGAARRAVIQYDGERSAADAVAQAVREGARVLLCPPDRTSPVPDAPDRATREQTALVRLRDAYDWDPLEMLPGLPTSAVVGLTTAVPAGAAGGAPLTPLLPHLAAFAEVAWSAPSLREWPSFATRLPRLIPGGRPPV